MSIQRSSGCDTMTCSRCQTLFCYRCGGRYYSSKYFGNHFSRLSVFGCKYRYRPNEPIKRRMIRGVIFGKRLDGELESPMIMQLLCDGCRSMHETAVDMQKVKHETVVWKILVRDKTTCMCFNVFFRPTFVTSNYGWFNLCPCESTRRFLGRFLSK